MRRPARLPAAAALVALAAALLGACSSPSDEPGDVRRQVEDATGTPPAVDRYVALGDSFTAAPLVPTTDLAGGCFRSDGNYPSLVADRLDVHRLVDVSCSGAETSDLTQRQRTVQDSSVPPQLGAVDPRADLVTLGIGGNDFDLFRTLLATCSGLRGQDPTGSPCAGVLRDRGVDLVSETDQIGDRVAAALGEIRRRAPDAKVLVVGYPRIAPTTGGCPQLPFAQGDLAFGDRVARGLNDALARAARRTGAGFVDMYAASRGHDVCSDEPWVNGRRTVQGEALAFHPFEAGMEAVADRVVDAVSR
jgi:lysophospholipase L1-like esterase